MTLTSADDGRTNVGNERGGVNVESRLHTYFYLAIYCITGIICGIN